MAKEIPLSRDDHVLDVACGRGASALMLAQVFKCRVTGVDSGHQAIDQAQKEARRYRLKSLVTFTQGDATCLTFPSATFSAALCECATSLFADRRVAFGELARVLCVGGRLALSDVTFRPDSPPEWMDSSLSRALCVPIGMGPERYAQLLAESGFLVQRSMDYSGAVAQIVDRVESLLGLGHLATLAMPLDGGALGQVRLALHHARELLQCGDLGYWAFIAEKA
jgi:SAM-dependent methyltransferase